MKGSRVRLSRRALLPGLAALPFAFAACASRPSLTSKTAPLPVTVPAAVPALPGPARVPPAQLLLSVSELPAGFQVVPGQNGQVHKGPGLASATVRFTRGSGAGQQSVYVRVSEFAVAGFATTEFVQEKGDISRSSTPLPANGQRIGDDWLGYTVASGTGAAATATFGVLFRARNYLGSVVLTGAPGTLTLADVLPIAQRQTNRIAGAK